MSIPHILLNSAAGTSATSTLPINSKHPSHNSKEHIRERLNMHVKKRIQSHDITPQYSLPAAVSSSSVYSTTSLSTALKPPTHPFLMSSWFFPPKYYIN